MSTLTNFLKLIKPSRLENYNVQTLNGNFDLVDAASVRIEPAGIPAGKQPRIWAGTLSTSTGKGGENKTATGATDAKGIGGLWFGEKGLPAFEGVAAVHLTQILYTDTAAFLATWQVISMNTTRIKFQGKRHDNSFAYEYGGIDFYVTVIGW